MAKIQELHEHFTAISGSVTKDGLIDRAEFTRALGMKDSLFVDRVFNLFDKNGDGARLRSAPSRQRLNRSALRGRYHQLSGVFDRVIRVLPFSQSRREVEVFVRHL